MQARKVEPETSRTEHKLLNSLKNYKIKISDKKNFQGKKATKGMNKIDIFKTPTTIFEQNSRFVKARNRGRHMTFIKASLEKKNKRLSPLNYPGNRQRGKFCRMGLGAKNENMFIFADEKVLLAIKGISRTPQMNKFTKKKKGFKIGNRSRKYHRGDIISRSLQKKDSNKLAQSSSNRDIFQSGDFERLKNRKRFEGYQPFDSVLELDFAKNFARTHAYDSLIDKVERSSFKRKKQQNRRKLREKKVENLTDLIKLEKSRIISGGREMNPENSNRYKIYFEGKNRKIDLMKQEVMYNATLNASNRYNVNLIENMKKIGRSKSSETEIENQLSPHPLYSNHLNRRNFGKGITKRMKSKERSSTVKKRSKGEGNIESLQNRKKRRMYFGSKEKQKGKGDVEEPQVFTVLIKMLQTKAFIDQKDFSHINKLNFIRDFGFKLNYSNAIFIKPVITKKKVLYRYYLTPRNNSVMLRQAMSKRWWWTSSGDMKDKGNNLVWTQSFQRDIFNRQPVLKEIEYTKQKDFSEIDEKNSKKSSEYSKLHSKFMIDTEVKKIEIHQMKKNGKTFEIEFSAYKEKLKPTLKKELTEVTNMENYTLHSKLHGQFNLGFKRSLYYNMRSYYRKIGKEVSNFLPLTFHVENLESEGFKEFTEYYKQEEISALKRFEDYKSSIPSNHDNKKNKLLTLENFRTIWILKPGENTCQGRGIKIKRELSEIQNFVLEKNQKKHTAIIQKYLKDPLLYKGRKFDIRCFALATSINGKIKAYWYKEGYIRTATVKFNLNNFESRASHLTNDSVQKHYKNYGKDENGNKLTFSQLDEYIKGNHQLGKEFDKPFYEVIYPKVKNTVRDCFRGVYSKLNPEGRFPNFQLYGFDFMVENSGDVWLLEANGNPALSICHNFKLESILVNLMEHMVQIAVDPLFPPPYYTKIDCAKKTAVPENIIKDNLFELFFDEERDGIELDPVPELEKVQDLIYNS